MTRLRHDWRLAWTRSAALGALGALLGSAPLLLAEAPVNPGDCTQQVVTAPPELTGAVAGQLGLPLGATGQFPGEPPVQITNPCVIHQGGFVWGPDLLTPGTSNEQDWTNSLKQPFTAYTTFLTHVDSGLESAEAHRDSLKAADLGVIFDLFEAFGGTVSQPSETVPHFFGFKPVRARWLRRQWGKLTPNALEPETEYLYSDPFAFGEVRQRGARLYCAARRAALLQAGTPSSLGERVGFPLDVLGVEIDFLVSRANVLVGGPEKFLGPKDGAAGDAFTRAFMIPLHFGTQVTPVRGLELPGFGEVRVPIGLVSADSELRTLADWRSVFVKPALACPGDPACVGGFVEMHSKEHQTATHTDAVLTADLSKGDPNTPTDDNHYHANANFPFFRIGPVEFFIGLGLDYEIGAFSRDDSSLLQGFPPNWPKPRRKGVLFENPEPPHVRYHEGAWTLNARRRQFFEWQVVPDGQTQPFWRAPVAPIFRPHDVRAVTDDDHAMTSRTTLTLKAEIGGKLGFDLGDPFSVTLTAKGGLGGSVSQHHLLRDALIAEDPRLPPAGFPHSMRPITALTVRPHSAADVTFSGLTAKLHFQLDLGFFGEISFDETLLDIAGSPLAKYDSEKPPTSDERFSLRLGTGSSAGHPVEQPLVHSHLPQGSDFPTFDQDVAACLADEAPVPDPIEPCPAESTSTAPPSADLCLYGPSDKLQRQVGQPLPLNVCTNTSAYVGSLKATPEQKACMASYLSFLCLPQSQAQPLFGGQPNVVSRVWNLEPSMNDALLDILKLCSVAFVNAQDPQATAKATALAQNLISVSACHENAILIPGKDVIQPVNPTTPPPAQAVSGCPK